jgi:hypothetical protein
MGLTLRREGCSQRMPINPTAPQHLGLTEHQISTPSDRCGELLCPKRVALSSLALAQLKALDNKLLIPLPRTRFGLDRARM